MRDSQRTNDNPHQQSFPVTSWTLIRKVQQGGEDDARKAMEVICRSYWYPLYAFARRSGFGAHDAEDVTQRFFQDMITHESLQRAREEKGHLRAFMLAMLKRIIAKHLRTANAAKREGGRGNIVSFDDLEAEEWYQNEPANITDPDRLFDRAWAEGVLKSAEAKLREECARSGDVESFDTLSEFLPLGDNATPYAKVAARLKIAEPTLRLQIHRMRKRYAKLIEGEIAQTVSDPAELKTELEHLMTAIGR
jgi:RNA polymerase sigma-70 factor (ECF subfamily)